MVKNAVVDLDIFRTSFAIIDVETTGIDARNDRIVEIAVRRFDPVTDEALTFDSLLNPERSMDSTYIHGIRSEDIKNAPRFSDVAPVLIDLLNARESGKNYRLL